MLNVREQLAKGIFKRTSSIETTIPKKSAFLGTITPTGHCDFEVPEDCEYLSRDMKRNIRLQKSNNARQQRKELRRIRQGS